MKLNAPLKIRPYTPSREYPLFSAVVLVFGMMAAGFGLGLLAAMVKRGIDLLVLFPIFFGTALGKAGCEILKANRVSDPVTPRVGAVLASLVLVTVMHYTDYQNVLSDFGGRRSLRAIEIFANLTPEQRALNLPEDITEEEFQRDLLIARQLRSFPEFLSFKAESGMEIAPFPTTVGFRLSGKEIWAYWGLEFLIIAFLGGGLVCRGRRYPYCKYTGKQMKPVWTGFTSLPVEALLGSVRDADGSALRAMPEACEGEEILQVEWFQPPVGGKADVAVLSSWLGSRRGKPILRPHSSYLIPKPMAEAFDGSLRASGLL